MKKNEPSIETSLSLFFNHDMGDLKQFTRIRYILSLLIQISGSAGSSSPKV